MGTYRLPSNTDWVTSSWQDHKNRNPPSGMPGTDYGSSYGAPAYAVEAGTVTVANHSTSSANGRHIGIRLNDGRETWCLHLSEIHVSVGQRVSRGQKIGETGASGFGDDWYYGPHIHQSLWPDDAWDDPTIDFEKYVGEPAPVPTPTPEAFTMSTEVLVTVKDSNNNDLPDSKRRAAFVNTDSGFYCDLSWLAVSDADGWAKSVGQPSATRLSDSAFDKFIGRLASIRPAVEATSG